jgi:hypothetical protein
MFQPSQTDVRRFFCGVYARVRGGLPLEPMQAVAARWVDEGRTNPFLHLSMHLSIEEQVAIDQPTGIRQAVGLLAARRNSLHEAHHEVMDCLGEMIWASQRSGLPPDSQAYLEAVRRCATRTA